MAGLLMAANCAAGPCVQVYTDPTTHQLIITANQNRPGTIVAPHPRPAPTRPYVAAPRPTVKPKPQTWIPYKVTPIVHRPYKPPVKRKPSVVHKVVTAALSLSDQITRLLPGSKILYQPSNGALTDVPVYFWSDTNSVFSVVTTILGVGVNVLMNPVIRLELWRWHNIFYIQCWRPISRFNDHSYLQEPWNYTINLIDLMGWIMGGSRCCHASNSRWCDRAEHIGNDSGVTCSYEFHTVKLCTYLSGR